MPLIMRTTKGGIDMREEARDTGPSARDCSWVIMPIGARTASAKNSIYTGIQLFSVILLISFLKLC